MKRRLIIILVALIASSTILQAQIVCGADRVDKYLHKIIEKKIGIVANHTTFVGNTHLVDTLNTLGCNIKYIFAPEHGFRGNADAGAKVDNSVDSKTGIKIVSLYGSSKTPADSIMNSIDILIFDLQDVGARFYTYLSTMHYVMQSAAKCGVEVIILDRPNPNGYYVDGPTLDMKNSSFVGIYPIPVVHGMTLGELALMAKGEGWIKDGDKLNLSVIECHNYTRDMRYELPINPSPNLKTMQSIYLYPSLCYFEATDVSVGRGTDTPFEIYGSPNIKGGEYTFTPKSMIGAKYPPQEGKLCYGESLSKLPEREICARGVTLKYIIDAYNRSGKPANFFNSFFEKLIGVDYVRDMIIEGATTEEIEAIWQQSVAQFMEDRAPYLLYK